MAELLVTKAYLNSEIDKDEIYWEQYAQANWIKLGDHNTKFFHRFTSFRKKG